MVLKNHHLKSTFPILSQPIILQCPLIHHQCFQISPFVKLFFLTLLPTKMSCQQMNLIINSISINTCQAVNIERETHMQSESQTWFSERKFRLTASRFGETIYKMIHSRCQPTNFAKKLTEEKNLYTNVYKIHAFCW